ncbi:MAG: DUF2911 domain-containing protein [Flavitalea sp.]
MKLKLSYALLLSTCFVFAGISNLNAQNKAPRESPKKTATGKINGATVTISYGSPSVKGRKIWGDLVPYDKVWRSGANEATQLETDKALTIHGKKLPAGKYSLYTIPGEKEWQVIINSQTGQWGIEGSGETTRKPANDVLVATVKPKKSTKMNESLVYEVNKNGVVLKWENLEVPISIK